MELNAEDVVVFDDGGERVAVRSCRDAGVRHWGGIGVREVDVGLRLEAGQSVW